MSFTDTVDAAEPTHRLVTRALPGVEDWDEDGGVTVENRAVGVLMDHGTAVYLRLDPKHDQFEAVERELTRVPDRERVFARSDREFRASLPADRALVESLLAVPVDDADAWTDRTFYLVEFAVLDGRSWVYRSVPHETHVREINATGHEGLLQELSETLNGVRGSAVVPFDGLDSWTTDGITYELRWDSLYRSADGDGVSYDLERLEGVTASFHENHLRLDWRPTAEESLVRRTLWRVLDPQAVSPPTRVGIPAGEAGERVFAAFHRLRRDLDYGYALRRSPRS